MRIHFHFHFHVPVRVKRVCLVVVTPGTVVSFHSPFSWSVLFVVVTSVCAVISSLVCANATVGAVATHPRSPAWHRRLREKATESKVASAPALCDTCVPSKNRGASRILSPWSNDAEGTDKGADYRQNRGSETGSLCKEAALGRARVVAEKKHGAVWAAREAADKADQHVLNFRQRLAELTERIHTDPDAYMAEDQWGIGEWHDAGGSCSGWQWDQPGDLGWEWRISLVLCSGCSQDSPTSRRVWQLRWAS